MHPSTRAAWQKFITGHEGEIAYMYLDTKGLVTIGIGNLIDPVSAAVGLPFRFKANNRAKVQAGRLATPQEIEAEWLALKHHPNKNALISGGATGCAALTDLELSPADRQQLFDHVTSTHEATLTKFFPEFPSWPGDAQLGLMAMAWGLGMQFPPKFPKFTAACRAQDFESAVLECKISNWREERNRASAALFGNAARVVRHPSSYDRSQTYFPTVLDALQLNV